MAAKLACEIPYLHLVRRFWNQVLTCASVIFRLLARAARSALARYFCRWKRFSSSQIWTLEKDVRGFFRFGGVRFWYGCPIRRVTANGTRAAEADKTGVQRWEEHYIFCCSKLTKPTPPHSVWKFKVIYHRNLPCLTTIPYLNRVRLHEKCEIKFIMKYESGQAVRKVQLKK